VDAGARLEGGGVDLVVTDPVANPDHAAGHQGGGDEAVVELGRGDLVAEGFEAAREVEGRGAVLLAEPVADAEGDAEAERDPQPARRPLRGIAVGMRTEPAPSELIAPATNPAATAAAAPPLEPPGVCASCQGLRVRPKAGVSVKCHCPTSGAWVLPTMIAPARFSRRTSSASARHVASSPPQPKGVVWPARSTSSLIATGTPSSGASAPPSPARRRASARSAAASAASAQITRKAFSVGWLASIRSRDSSTSSRAETSRERTRVACRARPAKASSGPSAAPGHPLASALPATFGAPAVPITTARY
jgi:hypothetical protein